MTERILIIGGGLSGLSAGCYARMSGFETHILEHAATTGGVCTAWSRAPYLVDGCIHWLTGAEPGGMFRRVYEELGVIRDVKLEPLRHFARFEDPGAGWALDLVQDLDDMQAKLQALGPDDTAAISQLFEAIREQRALQMPIDQPPELSSLADGMKRLWGMRKLAPLLIHFRGSVHDWADAHVTSAALRDVLKAVLIPEMPAIFLPFMLALIGTGQLSRPVGGSGAFSKAVATRYRELGGKLSLNTCVDEILVDADRVRGVRLEDGAILDADIVICTASAYETHLRLLGGRFLDRATRQRLDSWPTFDPVVLLSIGVETPLAQVPSSLVVRQADPLVVGGRPVEWLLLRVYNDAPWAAPRGHTVIQTMLPTSYEYWARQGASYADTKALVTQQVIERFEQRLPEIKGKVRMVDLSTPLTFWRWSRAWRGAYEGWLPTPDNFYDHVPKRVAGIENLYLAGQWVEQGGGVPPALLSGRQCAQIIAHDRARPFVVETPGARHGEPRVETPV